MSKTLFLFKSFLSKTLAGMSLVAALLASALVSANAALPGTVAAWGFNDSGQTTVPAGLSGVAAVAAGGYHTVAIGTVTAAVPSLPTGVTATIPTATTNIQVTWNAVSGATGYKVYMANVPGVTKANYASLGGHVHTGITGTSYTHTGLTSRIAQPQPVTVPLANVAGGPSGMTCRFGR